LAFPAKYLAAYLEVAGPPPNGGYLIPDSTAPLGFQWYRLPAGNVELSQGDRVAVIALNAFAVLSSGAIATVYTGPYSVDLTLQAAGRQYAPFETIDGDALFYYPGTDEFDVAHSAVGNITIAYIALFVYLSSLYPILIYLRRRRRPFPARPQEGLHTRPRDQDVGSMTSGPHEPLGVETAGDPDVSEGRSAK
jgi:hypothetical protein